MGSDEEPQTVCDSQRWAGVLVRAFHPKEGPGSTGGCLGKVRRV